MTQHYMIINKIKEKIIIFSETCATQGINLSLHKIFTKRNKLLCINRHIKNAQKQAVVKAKTQAVDI